VTVVINGQGEHAFPSPRRFLVSWDCLLGRRCVRRRIGLGITAGAGLRRRIFVNLCVLRLGLRISILTVVRRLVLAAATKDERKPKYGRRH